MEQDKPIATINVYSLDEMRSYLDGPKYELIVRELTGHLRQLIKYGHELHDATEALEYIQKYIHDSCAISLLD